MRLRLHLSSTALLCLALLCASGPLMAMESRHMGPDGGGSCPEATAPASDTNEDPDPDAASAPARRTQKASKPAASARSNAGGGNATRTATPRWHSFLPGMFR